MTATKYMPGDKISHKLHQKQSSKYIYIMKVHEGMIKDQTGTTPFIPGRSSAIITGSGV